ncbi:serine/threonine-protein kinase [Micromonospora avicenniae]|uniref:non-specific serine/threonine protein kinase n=1 Tax=Micromonospora avicenniae TaxID=1198245 RepID=A0A1N6VFI6_9ACTN|nr:serine/threonine-protein kinase [Micromonospora avicenniae]SIQ76564.1 Serine/threonine protein kinase [Micromonospora avicenniae]
MQESPASQRLVAGRYRLSGLLGRGGMGRVWRATDELIGRDVAVKEIRPGPGLSPAERVVSGKRALREARTAGRIHHPAVVTIHDVVPPDAEDDAVYIVSELVDAPNLADVLAADGAIPAARVCAIAVRILDALAAAHAIGVVHRDIKPSNIMLLGGDDVKLVDFGVAQGVGEERMTKSGVMGSGGYLAPELFHGAEPSPASDLWSVGVTLLEAVTGQAPFERPSTAATIHAVLYEDLPEVSCDPPLATAITALLQRDPDRRSTLQQTRAVLIGDAVAAQEPPGPPVPAAAAPEGEEWEQHRTRVHDSAGRRPVPRQRRMPAPPDADAGFPVSTPPRIRRTNLILRVILPLLCGWASWLLLYETLGVPPVMAFWAALLAFMFVALKVVHSSPPGLLHIREETLVFAIGRFPAGRPGGQVKLSWKDVGDVVVAPAAGSTDRSVLAVGLARGDWPSPETAGQFKGFLRVRPGGGLVWTVGDLRAAPDDVAAAILAVAPDHVRVESVADEPSRAVRHRPRRGALVFCLLLILGLIGGTHYYRYELKDAYALSKDATSVVAYAPDGTALAGATPGVITIWNLATRRADVLLGGQYDVTALGFSPDGKLLVSGDDSGNIKLWNVAARRAVATVSIRETDKYEIVSVQFSPDGTAVAALDELGDVGLWRLNNPAKLIPIDTEDMDVDSIRFSADNRVLLGLDESTGTRRFWQTSNGATTRPSGTFAPLADVQPDHSVLIRDARSDQILVTLRGNNDVIDAYAFGAGDLFATAAEAGIRVWRVSDGHLVQAVATGLFPLSGPGCDVIALNPDGRSIACAGEKGLRLWAFEHEDRA